MKGKGRYDKRGVKILFKHKGKPVLKYDLPSDHYEVEFAHKRILIWPDGTVMVESTIKDGEK
jgi:hypothetical protein